MRRHVGGARIDLPQLSDLAVTVATYVLCTGLTVFVAYHVLVDLVLR